MKKDKEGQQMKQIIQGKKMKEKIIKIKSQKKLKVSKQKIIKIN